LAFKKALASAYFGGYRKPANFVENRVDRRLASYQTGKRKAVIVIRERNGRSLPAVFRTEGQALSFIRSRIAKGTIINADESGSWDALHAQYEMKRVNHEEAYSLDGACTNWAEEFFSRMRRAEQGHHHHIAGNFNVDQEPGGGKTGKLAAGPSSELQPCQRF
jgi:ISXO2-like transposase domain